MHIISLDPALVMISHANAGVPVPGAGAGACGAGFGGASAGALVPLLGATDPYMILKALSPSDSLAMRSNPSLA